MHGCHDDSRDAGWGMAEELLSTDSEEMLEKKKMKGTDPGALAFRYRGGVDHLLLVLSLSDPGGVDPLPGLFCRSGTGHPVLGCGHDNQVRGEGSRGRQACDLGSLHSGKEPPVRGQCLYRDRMVHAFRKLLRFPAFHFVFIVLYVILVIPYEESFLKASFPEDFEQYSKKTGRFFPISIPGISDLAGPFQPAVLWKSERHSLWVLWQERW